MNILKKVLNFGRKKETYGAKHETEVLFNILTHLVLIVTGILFLMPILWMLLTSLKSNQQLFGGVWLPDPPVWSNYIEAVKRISFARYTVNTIYISVLNVVGTVFSCVLPAYGFARLKWPGRNMLFLIVIGTMMLPFQVTMIPVYIIFRKLGWIGTYHPLTIPAFFGVPFFIFLLRQFFTGIPEDLSDAARIDGASELGILFRVILPLSKAAVLTVALFTFMWTWNDFLYPLIYLNDDTMYTLSLGLQQYRVSHAVDWGPLMAAASIIILPMIVLFFFTQKNFIEGITMTGIKG